MKTMKQELLKLLLREWTTPISALNKVGCMSLSQRCGELRQDWLNGEAAEAMMGCRLTIKAPKIISKWVKLPNGKRVKAYRAIK